MNSNVGHVSQLMREPELVQGADLITKSERFPKLDFVHLVRCASSKASDRSVMPISC